MIFENIFSKIKGFLRIFLDFLRLFFFFQGQYPDFMRIFVQGPNVNFYVYFSKTKCGSFKFCFSRTTCRFLRIFSQGLNVEFTQIHN